MVFGSNFLILDEPTNDLDIRTLEILEDYLDNYDGCVVLISHDRFILDRIVDYLFIFQSDNSIRMFPGNYSDYLLVRKFEAETEADKKQIVDIKKPIIKAKISNKLSYKDERELEAVEIEIESLESKKAELIKTMQNEQASLNYNDYAKLSDELQAIEERILELFERWEALEMKKRWRSL